MGRRRLLKFSIVGGGVGMRKRSLIKFHLSEGEEGVGRRTQFN